MSTHEAQFLHLVCQGGGSPSPSVTPLFLTSGTIDGGQKGEPPPGKLNVKYLPGI